MRTFNMAVLVAAVAIFGSSGVAAAAPKDYCADLKGGNTGTSVRSSSPTRAITSTSASRWTIPTRSR